MGWSVWQANQTQNVRAGPRLGAGGGGTNQGVQQENKERKERGACERGQKVTRTDASTNTTDKKSRDRSASHRRGTSGHPS